MTTPTVTGLTHVVLMTPKRRADLTLPEHVPLAHLHSTLLRHGGDDLVEDGVSRGGWMVRRLDGTVLDPGQSLAALGIHNGDVIILSYRDQHWPEPSFDDLADGIAEDAARLGAVWHGTATAKAGVITGAVTLAAGLWLLISAGRPYDRVGLLSLVVAVVLLGTAALLSRIRGDDGATAAATGRRDPSLSFETVAGVLGAFAMIYAAAGGALVLGPEKLSGALTTWHLLAGAATTLLASVIGLVGVGTRRAIFYTGATLGLVGVVGALLAALSTPAGAVAGTAAGLVVLAPLLPRLAALQGGLPTPAVPNPAHGQIIPEPMPKPAELAVMVKRADDLLTGVLTGACIALFACVVVLGRIGDTTGVILAYLVVFIGALRMRMFAAVRHRLPLALTALGATTALLAQGWVTLSGQTRSELLMPVLVVLLLLASAAVAIGATFSRRPPSPGLSRLADVLEVLCIIVTPILACAAAGLFGLVRGLLNG